MAYQTGTLNSLADIQTVIRVFLTDNGWTWDSGASTIHKGSVFVRFIAPTTDKVLFTATTALSGGTDAPRQAGVGRLAADGGSSVPGVLTFPATYYAFLNDDEFYFVVKYDIVRFQYVMWGASTVENLGAGATGAYVSSTVTEASPYSGVGGGAAITIGPGDGGGNWYGTRSAAPFWATAQDLSYGFDLFADFVHTDFDGESWELRRASGSNKVSVGNSYAGNVQSVLPNAWNGESPLLPIRAYKYLAESKVALVVDLQHARQCRVDNFNDTEVIGIGSDEWQVFPFHRKDLGARNGGTAINHTGTFGWAIRKVA